MLPPPSSKPLRVRSYARAFAVAGSRSSVSGAVNGWWFDTHLPSSSLHSNRGGSKIPAELPSPLGDEAEPRRKIASGAVERHVRRGPPDPPRCTRGRPGSPPSARGCRRPRRREELLHRRANRRVVFDGHPHETRRPTSLGIVDELVELLAAEARAARRAQPLDRAAVGRDRRERPEPGPRKQVNQIDQLQLVPQVRLVRPEAIHALGERHPPERRRHLDAEHVTCMIRAYSGSITP